MAQAHRCTGWGNTFSHSTGQGLCVLKDQSREEGNRWGGKEGKEGGTGERRRQGEKADCTEGDLGPPVCRAGVPARAFLGNLGWHTGGAAGPCRSSSWHGTWDAAGAHRMLAGMVVAGDGVVTADTGEVPKPRPSPGASVR